MKATRKMMVMFSAAGLALGVIAAPSVEITAVQQQYPWTNTVDITYEVQGVTNMEYFVRFTPTTSDDQPILNTEGEASIQVALESNGVFTAQWYPQTNLQYTACKMTPAIFRGGSGGGNDYMIVDLETGAVTYEPMATQEASNQRYNTDEYKTTKMVFRKIAAGAYPVRRVKSDLSEFAAMATIDKDYYIGVFQVTAAQYNRIKDTPPYTDMMPKRSMSYTTLRGGALARANVAPSANGDVIARLNYKTGKFFDLPNLTMRQVAAHANQNKDWPWFFGPTDAELEKYAVFSGSIAVVGSRAANPWGIFDAYGNVWERCRDTVAYMRWNGVGNQTDDASLTLTPTQTGQYDYLHAGSPNYNRTIYRAGGVARDQSLSYQAGIDGFRLALIVE